MTGHGKEVCACGAVIRQCRCMQEHGTPRVVQLTCSKCEHDGPHPVPQPTEAEMKEKELEKLRSTYEASEAAYQRSKARYDKAYLLLADARQDLRVAEVARNEAYNRAQLAMLRHNQKRT